MGHHSMSRKTRILVALGVLVIVLLVLGGTLAWRENDDARRNRAAWFMAKRMAARFEAEQCAFLFALGEQARTADEAEAMRKVIFDAATTAH
jgi:hypothetical protein